MPQYLVAIHHPDGYDGSLEGGRHHQHLPARRTFAHRHHGRIGVATSKGGLK
jgi:hypothetical protein